MEPVPSIALAILYLLLARTPRADGSIADYSPESVTTVSFQGWANTDKTVFELKNTAIASPLADHDFSWEFGDGNRQEGISMATFVMEHTYSRRGVYSVSVTVVDWGQSEGKVVTFEVWVGKLQVEQSSPLVFHVGDTKNIGYRCKPSPCTGPMTLDKGNGDALVTLNSNPYLLTYSTSGDYNVTIALGNEENVTLLAVVRSLNGSISPQLETAPTAHQTYIGHENVPFQLTHNAKSDATQCALNYKEPGLNPVHQRLVTSPTLSTSHAYLGQGSYDVVAYCWDEDDVFVSNTVSVTVERIATRLTASSNSQILKISYTDMAWPVLQMDASRGLPLLEISKVDWGDGQTVTPKALVRVQTGNKDLAFLNHTYTLPGKYDMEVTVKTNPSGSSIKLPVVELHVAENLKIKVSPPSSDPVSEKSFKLVFSTLPVYEFGYIVDLGDGQGPQTVVTPTNYALPSTFRSPLTFSYLHAGSYTINVTTFNNVFKKTSTMDVEVVQGVPIRGWQLALLPNQTLIVGESAVGFQLVYHRHPNVTLPNVQVTCSLDVENSTETYLPKKGTIDYPITVKVPWTAVFDEIGKYLVSMDCEKNGQKHSLLLNVTVVNYTDVDYLMTYTKALAVNGTLTTLNTVYTEFTLALFDLESPLTHTTEWVYGDETPNTTLNLHSWTTTKLYEQRGIYHGHVKIFTPKGVFVRSFTVYIGISEMNVTPDAAIPGSTLSVTCKELLGVEASYVISYGDGTPDGEKTITGVFSQTHVYAKAGTYNIATSVTAEGLTEVLLYRAAVFIDHAPNSLSILLSTELIPQPPGELTLWVKMGVGGNKVKAMTCVINYDDELDQRNDVYTGGLKVDQDFKRFRMYIALGTHTISVNCTNRVGNYITTHTCTVKSECFSDEGIFETRYADPAFPMLIMSSNKVQITSRVEIQCKVTNITFVWDLWTLNATGFEPIEQVDIVQPGLDTYTIRKGDLQPNTYLLSLNVSMIYNGMSQWLYGLTYIKIIGSPLIAAFRGGLLRATGYEDAKINARSKSHDPDLGVKKKGSLKFQWQCQEYVGATDLRTFERLLANGVRGSHAECDHISQEIKPGVRQFKNLTDVARGYSFEVSVSTNTKDPVSVTSFVQYTKGAPEVEIQCLINCESKMAVNTVLAMEVECPFCFVEDFDEATISWTLLKLTAPNVFTEVPNLSSFSEPLDDNKATIVIRKSSLEACAVYALKVKVDMPSREKPGESFSDLVMNCPPRDGVCVTEPTSGEARSTNFKTTCTGWVDEGYYGVAGVAPLIYKFYIAQGDVAVPLFQGAQAMSPNKTLPVIPGTRGGSYDIMVRIFDILNDYTEVNNTIELEVVTLHSLSEVGDASRAAFSSEISSTVSILNKQLFETSYSSSVYQTIEVGTLDSFLSNYGNGLKLRKREVREITTEGSKQSEAQPATSTSTSDSSEPPFEAVWDTFRKQEEDAVLKQQLGNTYKTFTNQIEGKGDEVQTLDGQGLAALGEALAILMHSPETTDFDTAAMSNDLVNRGATTLQDLTSQVPFPIGEKVDEVVYGLCGALGRIVSKNSPSYTTEDTNIYVRSQQLGDRDNYFFKKRILDRKAEEDVVKVKKSQEGLPTFENSTKKILNAMQKSLVKGQLAKNIGRDGIVLTARKSTARSMPNKETESGDFAFSFPDAFNETVNGTDEILLKATMTKKNMYSWADDHSSYDVTSPVLNVVLETTNGTSVFAGNISLKIHRPMPEFNLYQVSDTQAGEDGFCHHQFQLKKSSETSYVYVDIGGQLGPVTGYFRNGLPPTSYSPGVLVRDGEYVTFNSDSSTSSRRKRSASEGQSQLLKFILEPGDMAVGLVYMGMDFSNLTTNISQYSFLAYSDSCRVWDTEKNVWSNTSCKVSPYSTPYETICDCRDSPGYNFGSTFYVPPNLINFNMVFSKFQLENAAVYGTVLVLFFMFGMAMIWAHRKGRQDHGRWKVGYLMDNFVGDHYFYLLTVHTGLGGSSGTTSRVSFILTGSKGDSGVRLLSDGQRHLETGTVMSFIMATDQCLGELTFLRIWHDNSGDGSKQSWYLNKLYVEDIQNNIRSTFGCDQWLAIDKDDGLIDRILPVSFNDDIMTFSKLFAEHSRINISDSHLWMSIFIRPERSMFTRLQRVACCLLTLLLAMISSALFFKAEDVEGNSSNASGNEFQIGTLRFSMNTLYTSSVGILITLPPILLIVCLFKSRRPWKSRACCSKRNRLQEEQEEEQERTLHYWLKKAGSMQGVVSTGEDPLMTKFHKNPLPPCCLLVAWGLLLLGILTCAFAIILYSMQWGKTVSEEWLASFVLSFIESIFILDPLKVLFLSAMFALCMRNPGGDVNSNIPLEEIGKQSEQNGCHELDMTVLPPDPIPEEVLEKARKRKIEENAAYGVFVELLLYVFFVFCLFSASYANRDGRSFLLSEHLQNSLTSMPFRKSPLRYFGTDKEPFTWSRIKNTDDVYVWLNETMISAMLPWIDVAGNALPWEQQLFISDLANYRLGPVRVRQVRMPRSIPSPIKEDPTFVGPKISHQVNLVGTKARSLPYDISEEETESFCLGWKAKPCSYLTTPVTVGAWAYRSSVDEQTFPVAGKFTVYSGAAYVVDLIFNRHIVSDAYLLELINNQWLDIQTSAVFVEFSLYNANLNLFTVVRLVAEFPEYGGAFTTVDVKPKRFYDHVGALGTYVLICQVVMVITALVFSVKMIMKIVKQRCAFFVGAWNLLDFVIIVLCFIAVFFYTLRRVYFTLAMEGFKKDPKVFVNLYLTIIFDDVYGWVLGALVFFCTLRLMRILGYNQRITMIAAVLRRAHKELLSFAFVFIIAMTAFAFTGYTLFHSNLTSFLSVWEAYVTLIYMVLGKNVFKQMVVVSAIVSRVYFFILAVALVFFFMTIFQSILNASASQVRLDVINAPSPYGVMDVVHKIYKSLVLDNRLVEYLKRRIQNEHVTSVAEGGVAYNQEDDISQTQKVLSVLREHFYKSMGKELNPDEENITEDDTLGNRDDSPDKDYDTEWDGDGSRVIQSPVQTDRIHSKLDGQSTPVDSQASGIRSKQAGRGTLLGNARARLIDKVNSNGKYSKMHIDDGDSKYNKGDLLMASNVKLLKHSFADTRGFGADVTPRVNQHRHPRAPPIPPSMLPSKDRVPGKRPDSLTSPYDGFSQTHTLPHAAAGHHPSSPWSFPPMDHSHAYRGPLFPFYSDNETALENTTWESRRNLGLPANPFHFGLESDADGKIPSVFKRANAKDD